MFAFKRISGFAALALALLPITAQAKEDLCNKHLPLDLAVGDYTIKFLPGRFLMRGMVVPMNGDTAPGKISMVDGKLVLTSTHSFQATFVDQKISIDEWWPEENVITDVGLEQTDIMLCQTKENLPRMLADATGGYFSQGGIKVDTKLGLLVYEITDKGVFANGFLTGSGSYNGMPFTLKGPIELAPK